jgi:hypothetical protein
MSRNSLVLLIVLLAAQVCLGQEEDIDPSRPTNLYTNIDFNFEIQDHPGDGDLYGLNIIPAIAFNDQNKLDAEIPILRTAYEDTGNTTGIGDIRLRYFYVPYNADDSDHWFTAAGLSVDVYLPTGDEETGHGAGSTLLAPGVTFGVRAASWLDIFPILSYQHSFGAGRWEPGGTDPGGVIPPPDESDEEVDMRGVRAEAILVAPLPRDAWIQIIPLYSRNLVNGDHALNVRVMLGKMLNTKNALQFEYQREFVNQRSLQNMIRIAWSYFL